MSNILVAMSGGVDSSVAAYLLKKAGHSCVGVTMRLYDNELLRMSGESTCCSVDDVEDARSVCAKLGIPFLTLDLSKEFRSQVIDKFAREYKLGNTPNPCIDCNRFIKFRALLDRAPELGCDFIATGHYAILKQTPNGPKLRKGLDETKDQSYVLAQLPPSVLERTFLPLGNLTKEEVRGIAHMEGLINASKRESQDICFVPDGDYISFLERYTGEPSLPGDVIDMDGVKLGTHRGAAAYTLGQRKGLGVASSSPLYVVRKSMAENTVTLGPGEKLFSRSCVVTDFNWIERPALPTRASARLRYRQREADCTVAEDPSGDVLLTFDRPQRAITTGQSAVIYDGDTVLGGGTIASVPEI